MTYDACSDAAEAALNRAGCEKYSYAPDAEVYHVSFLALSKAGTLPDGRALARVALDVFADDPTWCSDVIRPSAAMRRRPARNPGSRRRAAPRLLRRQRGPGPRPGPRQEQERTARSQAPGLR